MSTTAIFMIALSAILCVVVAKKSPLDGARITTWNINSVGRWGRDKGDTVKATFESVLNRSSILGMQEATGFEENHFERWNDRYEICSLETEPAGSRARTYHQFAVLVKMADYKVVGVGAEALPLDEVYGIKCVILPQDKRNTRQNRQDYGIVVYNIHLKAGKSKDDASERDAELSRLLEEVKSEQTTIGAQVILGDFNYYEKTDGRERWAQLFSTVGIDFAGVLEESQKTIGYTANVQGQGFLETTPGGGTYDGIFVPGHVGSYFSPNSNTSLKLFVPQNPKGHYVMTDYELSDHLPIMGSIEHIGKVASYNIQYFQISSVMQNKNLTAVYSALFDRMDLVFLQELMREKVLDRKELLDTMFSGHDWAVGDQYACGHRAPYRLVGEAKLVDIGNGAREGLLCKFTKTESDRDIDVCFLNLHVLNSMAKKSDISRVIKFVRLLMEKDPFCHLAYNVILGDFNNQLLQKSAYDKAWPSLERLDCKHKYNQSWTYTAIDYKNRLDHILVAPPYYGPAHVTGSCDVLSQLSGQPFKYKLESWREVSDHFPVIATFDRHDDDSSYRRRSARSMGRR